MGNKVNQDATRRRLPTTMAELPEFAKATEVASVLNTSPTQVWAWAWRGDLERVVFSERVVRIPRSSVEKFVAERRGRS